MLDAATYATERAICDKANIFWKLNADYDRNGGSSLSAERAAHPDYAACDNAMRGRVNQYEILRDIAKLDRLTVYVSSDGRNVTTWTCDVLGTCHQTSTWRMGCYAARMFSYRVTISGHVFTGRGQGAGMMLNLRRAKG